MCMLKCLKKIWSGLRSDLRSVCFFVFMCNISSINTPLVFVFKISWVENKSLWVNCFLVYDCCLSVFLCESCECYYRKLFCECFSFLLWVFFFDDSNLCACFVRWWSVLILFWNKRVIEFFWWSGCRLFVEWLKILTFWNKMKYILF